MKYPLRRPGFLLAVFALIFCAQVVPRWWSDSIVMDEEWEITGGYEYWKMGDVSTAFGSTASGSLPALPLLALDLKRETFLSTFSLPQRSIIFLFINNYSSLPLITILARSVNLILCLLVLFLLHRCVRGSPWTEQAAALALWAFDPTWLALGGTAKSDCAGALWMFLLVYFFRRVQEKPSGRGYAAAGFLCAIATTSRHTDFSAPLILLALEAAVFLPRLHDYFHSQGERGKSFPPDGSHNEKWLPRLRDFFRSQGERGKSFPPDGSHNEKWPPRLREFRKSQVRWNLLSRWSALAAGYALWISLAFLPGTFTDPRHLTPFHYYLEYLGDFSHALDVVRQGSYFMAGDPSGGNALTFFPYHYFFKSTLSFILLLGLATVLILRRVLRLEPWIWIPPVLHLWLCWVLNPHLLPRHILPASPFLILAAARAFQWLWETGRPMHPWVRALPILLLAWYQVGAVLQGPHALSYANECLPKNLKPKYLSKFTWQLDQDVKRLAETGKQRGWKNVKLVSAGRIDPSFYGLSWEPFRRDELQRPRDGCIYVADASLFQVMPNDAGEFQWWKSWLTHVPPTGRVGDTWFYYEIPGPKRPASPSPLLPSFLYFDDGYPFYRLDFRPGTL